MRFGAPLLALLVVSACAGGSAGHASSPTAAPSAAALPVGFAAYDGGDLGFRLGLAPGWTESVRDAQGVSFADSSQRASMLVHVDSAQATDLQVASAQLMIQLTGGGQGGSNRTGLDVTLAGLPARRVGGTYSLVGSQQRVEAIVALEGPRAWALAMVAPPDEFEADRADFDRMVATFSLSRSHPNPPARAALGLPAPAFDVSGPAGRIQLDRVRGPVVVNFFATWCGPCKQEMPLLASRAAGSGNRFTVLGIDTHDDASGVPAFLKELGVSFPVGYDSSGAVADRYQLPGVPGTFFLDSDHVLRKSVLGPLSSETLQQGLQAAGAL